MMETRPPGPRLPKGRMGRWATDPRPWVRIGVGAGLLAFCGWAAVVAPGAEPAGGAAPDLFLAVPVAEHVPDSGRVTNLVWYVGARQFRIAPIPGWRVKVNQPLRRLEFLDAEGKAAILLRYDVLTNAPASLDLQALAESRHEGFRVAGESELGSGCGRAKVFDMVQGLERERISRAMAARRTALVQIEEGVLECTLSTTVRSYTDFFVVYSRFLVGVRSVTPPVRAP